MAALIAFMDDLMFLSRVREAARAQGLELQALRTVDALLAACRLEAPRLVLVDLDSPRIPSLEAIGALRGRAELAAIPVVGFFAHVHAERAGAAREAGCTRVLARGQFVNELPSLLAAS
jgi:CheY-like chemotaxis protein